MDELNEHFFFPTAKTTRQRDKDVAPVCIVKIGSIGGVSLDKPLLCLLDTRSTTTMIQWKALPAGCVPMKSNVKSVTTTANGTFDTLMSVSLRDIVIPEFVNGRIVIVDGVPGARMFNKPSCRYDIIFCCDFLQAAGMKFCFDTNTIHWIDAKIDTKPVNYFTRETFIEDDALFMEWLDKMFLMVSEEKEDLKLFELNRMMQSQAYGVVTTQEVVNRQEHLNEEQKKQFK